MDKITTSSVDDRDRADESPATVGDGTGPGRDRTNRRAALIATLVALPITLLVAGVTFARLAPDDPAPAPSPSATTARAQSTAPVEMAAPALAERPAVLCRALLSQLPPTVGDLNQRPVTAGPEQNAAYGDPALTLACGGAEPTVPATGDVWMVNKVCWYAAEQADATVLTTVDRETAVAVRVPREYGQPLQRVAPISDTVVAAVPSGGDIPTGCRG
ncbi:DUF3515 family protein [Micromonospora sp. WMMD812]|uniref:DUF3515 family protein n=1 Tax=Micromonospora sp. WMMD812 TaxID=3015152 RepID=UPI00248D3155|nr:DUF3515 family protein [Micromonospora sp. WMMD812]WBB70476.1 DUF3515 family protein [Micromonospora sp. WMMD812]